MQDFPVMVEISTVTGIFVFDVAVNKIHNKAKCFPQKEKYNTTSGAMYFDVRYQERRGDATFFCIWINTLLEILCPFPVYIHFD